MKKPTNPSKVIIIPQTPQNNNKQEVAPSSAPAEKEAPAQAPAQQQTAAEEVEEEAE